MDGKTQGRAAREQNRINAGVGCGSGANECEAIVVYFGVGNRILRQPSGRRADGRKRGGKRFSGAARAGMGVRSQKGGSVGDEGCPCAVWDYFGEEWWGALENGRAVSPGSGREAGQRKTVDLLDRAGRCDCNFTVVPGANADSRSGGVCANFGSVECGGAGAGDECGIYPSVGKGA